MTKPKMLKSFPIQTISRLSKGYKTIGACSVRFNNLSEDKRCLLLLAEGLGLIYQFGFPVERVFAALYDIDELRPWLTDDKWAQLIFGP